MNCRNIGALPFFLSFCITDCSRNTVIHYTVVAVLVAVVFAEQLLIHLNRKEVHNAHKPQKEPIANTNCVRL